MTQLKIKKEAAFSTAEAQQLAGFMLVAMYSIPKKCSMENFLRTGKMNLGESAVKPETAPGKSGFAVRSGARSGVLWISPDKARQYHDLYSYTGGNPINLVDPDGNAAGVAAAIAIGLILANPHEVGENSNPNTGGPGDIIVTGLLGAAIGKVFGKFFGKLWRSAK